MCWSKGLWSWHLAVGYFVYLVRCVISDTTKTYIPHSHCSWTKLKYPIPKEKRIRLAVLYFELCTTPGMPINVIAACADSFVVLTRSRNKLSIEDLRLPWKPIYSILKQDLFLTRREFEYKSVPFNTKYPTQLITVHEASFHGAWAIWLMQRTGSFIRSLWTRCSARLCPR